MGRCTIDVQRDWLFSMFGDNGVGIMRVGELAAESAVEEGLEEVFGLAQGFALLGAEVLMFVDDFG
jgi:hypothetical protein